jgi:hypothetical protein
LIYFQERRKIPKNCTINRALFPLSNTQFVDVALHRKIYFQKPLTFEWLCCIISL